MPNQIGMVSVPMSRPAPPLETVSRKSVPARRRPLDSNIMFSMSQSVQGQALNHQSHVIDPAVGNFPGPHNMVDTNTHSNSPSSLLKGQCYSPMPYIPQTKAPSMQRQVADTGQTRPAYFSPVELQSESKSLPKDESLSEQSLQSKILVDNQATKGYQTMSTRSSIDHDSVVQTRPAVPIRNHISPLPARHLFDGHEDTSEENAVSLKDTDLVPISDEQSNWLKQNFVHQPEIVLSSPDSSADEAAYV